MFGDARAPSRAPAPFAGAAAPALPPDVLLLLGSFLGPLAAVRLCRTCRAFAATLAAHAGLLYSGFGAGALGRRGLRAALEARWRRAGPDAAELDDSFAGACAGGHGALARWLAARPAAPSPAAADAALLALVAAGGDCDLAAWLLGESPARPTARGAGAAFVLACGLGYRGLAELAWRAAGAGAGPEARATLAREGAASAAKTARHAHVVQWVEGGLLPRLEREARSERRLRGEGP